jgi:hypothetical protein
LSKAFQGIGAARDNRNWRQIIITGQNAVESPGWPILVTLDLLLPHADT